MLVLANPMTASGMADSRLRVIRGTSDLTILDDGGSGVACVACPGRPPGQ
jgi:hypothetical protein